jgi:exopolysaccharide biosynthesis WecB/TagA/CpsF family protein
LCDSKILNLACRFLGKPFLEVIPGSSLLPAYYNFHKNNKNIRLFLLGATEGAGLKAMNNINKKVGWDMVVTAYSPSFGFENNETECDDIVKMINQSAANVLIVGLGAPKQEKWIVKNKSRLFKINLIMALGATIDFEAGKINRAPLYIQKCNLEWLYRLYNEPLRLWKRYLVDDLPFFYFILKQKMGVYKNPFQ